MAKVFRMCYMCFHLHDPRTCSQVRRLVLNNAEPMTLWVLELRREEKIAGDGHRDVSKENAAPRPYVWHDGY